jgi:nucleoid DNA-binding protein
MSLSDTQLAGTLASRAGLSQVDANGAVSALAEVILQELDDAPDAHRGGVVELTVRVTPGRAVREGRNPLSGEVVTIDATRASVALIRARLTPGD